MVSPEMFVAVVSYRFDVMASSGTVLFELSCGIPCSGMDETVRVVVDGPD